MVRVLRPPNQGQGQGQMEGGVGGGPLLEWWEECMGGAKLSSLLPSLPSALAAAALLCKAVDLLMIANPLPEGPASKDKCATANADVAQRSSNVLCCTPLCGRQAGRYCSYAASEVSE
jgi:hypothetical protein